MDRVDSVKIKEIENDIKLIKEEIDKNNNSFNKYSNDNNDELDNLYGKLANLEQQLEILYNE
jgi:selenocysteine-specific translation elongation factor